MPSLVCGLQSFDRGPSTGEPRTKEDGTVTVTPARCITLQDYNEEVLLQATVPNFATNVGAHGRDACDRELKESRESGMVAAAERSTTETTTQLHFVRCDWHQLYDMILAGRPAGEDDGGNARALVSSHDVEQPHKRQPNDDGGRCAGPFDLILGADVTFTPQACADVAALIGLCMRRNSNCVALIATKRYYYGTHGGVTEFCSALRAEITTTKNRRGHDGGQCSACLV